MALILSCLVKDSAQTRIILDGLRRDGWKAEDIAVLHPGERLATEIASQQHEMGAQTAAVAGGVGAVTVGAFGWLVGYGVLAIPAALIGAAVGTAAGAAVGVSHNDDANLRELLVAHYRPRIGNDRNSTQCAAVLVRAEDAHGFDVVMRSFRAAGGEDIQVVGKGRMEPNPAHARAAT